MKFNLIGNNFKFKEKNLTEDIAYNDHKIKFVLNFVKNKKVLDIGCVQHNPLNYKSKYWLHKAIKRYSKKLIGLDLFSEGVEYLRGKGFDVITANAENFELGQYFDVIVAGDIIEHLNNPGNFLESCKYHMHEKSVLLISTPNPWYWKNIIKVILFGQFKNNAEHTCWFDPVTLSQLVKRYGFEVDSIHYGSRFLIDLIIPLPRTIKNTSFHCVLKLEDK